MRRPTRSPRLATLCVLGDTASSAHDNKARIDLLHVLEKALQRNRDWHQLDAILLPGGFFWLSTALETASFDQRVARIRRSPFAAAIFALLRQLSEQSPGLKLVTGVMAQSRDKRERTEQACVAFDRHAVVGVARKIFPTLAESRGRRVMSAVVDDYSSSQRFIDLANGSIAALHACYDLFGTADLGTIGSTRRAAIRTMRSARGRLTERDEGFRSERAYRVSQWHTLLRERAPDVLLTSIHGFQRPGLDGYWQRHGIARASAALNGAFALGAAHFLEALPASGSTLAACRVPRIALTAGVTRRAYSLAPIATLPLSASGVESRLRLFEPVLAGSTTTFRRPA